MVKKRGKKTGSLPASPWQGERKRDAKATGKFTTPPSQKHQSDHRDEPKDSGGCTDRAKKREKRRGGGSGPEKLPVKKKNEG